MTTGERLVELSGLSSGTAIEHLVALGDFGATTTGEQLQQASPLDTATAIEHLIAIDGNVVIIPGGGGAKAGFPYVREPRIKTPSREELIIEDEEEVLMLIKMITRCL